MALIDSKFFMEKRSFVDRLVYNMFCEIADCLLQVYAEENHIISGWFCVFLLKVARFIEAPFSRRKIPRLLRGVFTTQQQTVRSIGSGQLLTTVFG